MQVDDVRHHGRADDPDRDQERLALELRREELVGHQARVGRHPEQLERERDHDHPDEHGDHGLQAAEAGSLQREDGERAADRDHGAPAERNPEQQAEAERRAQHLREVGRHRDHLGLDPQREGDPAREVVAADLGEVAAGGDPELRRERLHDHGHQVRREHRPEQQVAVLRPRGDVGREVAGIEVGDGGDERGPEERPERLQARATPVERLLSGPQGRRLARKDLPDQIAFARPPRDELSHEGVCTRIARANTAPST